MSGPRAGHFCIATCWWWPQGALGTHQTWGPLSSQATAAAVEAPTPFSRDPFCVEYDMHSTPWRCVLGQPCLTPSLSIKKE